MSGCQVIHRKSPGGDAKGDQGPSVGQLRWCECAAPQLVSAKGAERVRGHKCVWCWRAGVECMGVEGCGVVDQFARSSGCCLAPTAFGRHVLRCAGVGASLCIARAHMRTCAGCVWGCEED